MGIGKAIGLATGVLTLLGMLYAGANHFQTRAEASANKEEIYNRLAQVKTENAEAISRAEKDREIGDLESQLKVANLELDYLLNLPSRSARENTRMELLVATITELEKRLRDLRGVH